MFIVLLRFSANRAEAGQFMQAHNEWLGRGFDDGVFAMAGSLQPEAGGVILARGASLTELRARVDEDPFVAADVVSAEILEFTPGRSDARLAFLKE